ncbi:Hypothetical predicted protein [Mytilus galloprovincialis]|uniref:Uncharacterized protein n=1 Tax=Mytilus galloprovincialis TaxID=29158 RepID=A0A8B6H243_MYTGA|nr:Hypothetical predicted protein [Mytilus galloprovincialis]
MYYSKYGDMHKQVEAKLSLPTDITTDGVTTATTKSEYINELDIIDYEFKKRLRLVSSASHVQ